MKPFALSVLCLGALLSIAACRSVPLETEGLLDDFVVLAVSDFETGRADGWRPDDPARWRVWGGKGAMVYELTAPGEPGRLRAPTSWSVWEGHDMGSFDFSGRLRCDADPANDKRDMCVFFHFQDPEHYYYVHFSASSDAVHNIIGLVNGEDRVKINAEPAGISPAQLTDRAWHRFKVTCDAASGEIRAYLDDMTRPVLTAFDKRIAHGLVGVGSFDDTGAFDDLKLRGLKSK